MCPGCILLLINKTSPVIHVWHRNRNNLSPLSQSFYNQDHNLFMYLMYSYFKCYFKFRFNTSNFVTQLYSASRYSTLKWHDIAHYSDTIQHTEATRYSTLKWHDTAHWSDTIQHTEVTRYSTMKWDELSKVIICPITTTKPIT